MSARRSSATAKPPVDLVGFVFDQGNTVLLMEYRPDVIKTADWIIEFGPGGSEGGTRLVEGTSALATTTESYTGQILAPVLGR